MGIVPLALVLIAAVGLATSGALAALRGPLLRRVGAIEPAQRARWLLALLAAPALVGLVAFAVAVAPCAASFVLLGLDDCRSHVGDLCRLCLAHPTHATALAWLLGAACLAPVVARAIRVGAAVRASRAALRALRPVARREGRLWVVPGAAAFVAGWPRGVVCVGETLAARLEPGGLAAVAAHERAHLRRGDVHRKLAARLLAATHVPGMGRALVDALDLAIEQACDADAAVAVNDPLVVAQALIDVARLEAPAPTGLCAAFMAGALEARVEALCAPRWRPPGRAARLLALGVSLALALGVAFADDVHRAADALAGVLG